jgi:nondiscriminating glutamyl-tRNA synthetase
MVITRFAPSPTGYLHVGGLRTALYAYLFARKNGGRFLLRIEDTDQSRYVEGAEEAIKQSLLWAGLSWDNEDIVRQSSRLTVYQKYAEQLVEEGKAYYCFCTAERLAEMREMQQREKRAPKYDRRCLSVDIEDAKRRIEAGEKAVIRFRIPNDPEIVSFVDTIRGAVSVGVSSIDDQVLLKSDGFPTYHLANVVDDHEFGVTHVIRGEEWLSSTPKHLLLYEAFGWNPPEYAHLPLLLNADRSKLSKRQGDVSVEEYRKKGYLPEALVNFVALLGWNPGGGSTEEFFALSELEQAFDLDAVNKAGAVFDLKRLDWMNAHYIKQLSPEALLENAEPFWKVFFAEMGIERSSFDEIFLSRVLAVERERLSKFADVGRYNPFFFVRPEVSIEDLRWKDMSASSVGESLRRAEDVLKNMNKEDWTRDNLEQVLLSQAQDGKKGEFFWPVRMALSGAKQSPPPHEIAWVIGKEETLARIAEALRHCD